MRKIYFLLASALFFSVTTKAQLVDSTVAVETKKVKTDWTKVKLNNRPNDHIMLSFGHEGWSGSTEGLNIGGGISRHFNLAFMYDMPFKTQAQFSFAGGIGISTSNVFFKDTYIDIAGKTNGNQITFKDVSDEDHFKKYKLSANYVEIPVEIRWVQNPLKSSKSFKVAAGVKLGLLVDAHTKGKNLVNEDGNTLYGTKYKMKEKSTTFFNSTKFAGTLRAGYGPISLFGSYNILTLFKDGRGPSVRPYSIGICISGL
ncbi:outer membrane beta-barrel protein [Polluticaenibacter yanchengensis]|uniref:Outer membrane beta-barrel protein n=1 Tax=Polluticaenibacter yanchengensis TaxID=3014562 RepID=A0ABT4UH22_9BACT|nr:outer membrane beta-barrel protein [Chitinophagaceae bacterium LY-5]